MAENLDRRQFLKGSLSGLIGLSLESRLPMAILGLGKELQIESKEPFNLRRVKEYINSTSGVFYELQSMAEDGEYYPSFCNAVLEKGESSAKSEITGGFPEDLKFMTQLGTFAETVDDQESMSLLKKYEDRILVDSDLRILAEHLSRDKHVFAILKQFFEDGGKIIPGRGHCNPTPLEIGFGYHEDVSQNEGVLYHELLHYAFDKEDFALAESYDSGGADHYVIHPLEERFNIISSILRGEMPLGKSIRNLYGFTSEGKAGESIKQFLQNGDLDGLAQYIASNDFHKNYVHSGMITPLSSLEFSKDHRIFRLKLSNGDTLSITEDFTQKGRPDSIEKVKYSDGVYIDVAVGDVGKFDIKSLMPYVPASDQENIKAFLDEHIRNIDKDRNYLLSQEQIHDIAYLNAHNAVILESFFNLAIKFSQERGVSFEKVCADKDYNIIFLSFLKNFTSLEQQKTKYFSIRAKAREIVEQLIKII